MNHENDIRLITKTEHQFRRQLFRDAVLILVITAISAMGIVFTLYYSVKHGW